MTKKSEALTRRQQYWLEQLQACDAAGKTVADYAAEYGLSARAMYSAKKALVSKGALSKAQAGRFQRAQVIDGVVTTSEWQVRLPNGVSVAFCGEVDGEALSTVLTAAARLE